MPLNLTIKKEMRKLKLLQKENKGQCEKIEQLKGSYKVIDFTILLSFSVTQNE